MNKKILITSLLSISLAVSAGATVGFITANSKGSGAYHWENVGFDERYSYNDTLELTPAKLVKDGQEFVATQVVTYPDGKTTSNDSVFLDQIGNYTIDYTANANGKIYGESYTFNVMYGAFYGESTNTTFKYGHSDNATTDGLMVSLAKDDTFHATQHIDMTNLTKTDVLVKGYIAPTNVGMTDFTTLTFMFTDSKDPSIYLRVSYFAYEITSQGGWSFAGAGGNGQEICGWLASRNQVMRGNGTGASMMTSFSSVRRNTVNGVYEAKEQPDDAYPFQISLDASEMIVYGSSYSLICDLDNSTYFDEFWTGFPSGKADLSIKADGYSGSSGTVVLSEIRGYDNLDGYVFEDNQGPEITLDTDYDSLPCGVIGKYYNIPKAKGYDDYSRDCDVKVEVIYDFAGENPTNVTVNNGTFIPKNVGPYCIRYSSTDKANNVTYLNKIVNVYASLDPIDFDLPTNPITESSIGESIKLGKPTNFTGGSGNKTYKVIASLGDRKVEVLDEFVPDDIGTWTISYVATDYIGQTASKSYDLVVTMDSEWALYGEPKFLANYISDSVYDLPEVKLFHKVNNAVSIVDGNITIDDGNGTHEYASKGEFTPHVENNGDTVKFSVISGGVKLFEKSTRGVKAFDKVTDEDGLTYSSLSLRNYFVGEGYEIESLSDSGMKVKASNNAGNLTFINPLKANKVTVGLNKVSSRSTNASMTFKLVDCLNDNQSISIKMQTNGLDLVFVYGDKSMLAEYTFVNPNKNTYSFGFDGEYLFINSFKAKVSTYDNGNPFEGFSNKVSLVIEYDGFNIDDSFVFTTICNQTLNAAISDKAAPLIDLTGEYVIAHEINEVIDLPKAETFDVLSWCTDFKVTMVDDNKEYAVATDGTILNNAPYKDDYRIELSKYGQYHITYSSSESSCFTKNANTRNVEIYLVVIDKVPPVITLTSGYRTEIKVNEYIVLPDFTVSDNVTDSDNIRQITYINAPDGKTYYLENTTEANREVDAQGNKLPKVNAMKAIREGVYDVYIIAVDESGNMTTFKYQVNVEREAN